MIVRYNTMIPNLKTGQNLLLVIIDGCLATRQNGFICYIWYYKTITMATRLSILAYCYGIPERHTDVSIHGFIEISSNTRVYQKIIIYFKKIKTRDKQLSKLQNLHSSIWMHNINFSHILYLNTLHTCVSIVQFEVHYSFTSKK